MSQLVVKFREEGEIIARIFPPEQGVLLAWSKIVFSELVSRRLPCHLLLRSSLTLALSPPDHDLHPPTSGVRHLAFGAPLPAMLRR